MYVLLYKKTLLNIKDLDSSLPSVVSSLPSVVSSLLHKFEDVFLEDGPSSLPLEKTKELQCQLEELITPCATHVLLVSKKDCS